MPRASSPSRSVVRRSALLCALMLAASLDAGAMAQAAPAVVAATTAPVASPAGPAPVATTGSLAIAPAPVTIAPAAASHKAANAAATKPPRKSEITRPTWVELTPAQRTGLAPLAAEWDKIEANRKEKWLVIGNRYASMTPTEQQRIHERMREWLKLTPAERKAVRENYARAQKLDSEQKTAQWKEYQLLSEEQKKQLSQTKLPKNVAALPPPQKRAVAPIKLAPEPGLEQAAIPAAATAPAGAPAAAVDK